MPAIVRERVRTHWTRERMTLVVLGLVCFYITYVSYRNLKSFLPFVMGDTKYDRELHLVDRALFFGHEPGLLLHNVLGTGVAAHFLSYIYLWFLPLVPLALTAWLIWSRNISYGYWFATSQCIAWSLGTLSYYALPTLGPGPRVPLALHRPARHPDVGADGVARRHPTTRGPRRRSSDAVQSVAGFASLHTAITLLVALMVQYTLRTQVAEVGLLGQLRRHRVATLYFGWHYIADDIAGIMIALVAFYVGGIASGQKFDRHGLASHPTADSSQVPVLED